MVGLAPLGPPYHCRERTPCRSAGGGAAPIRRSARYHDQRVPRGPLTQSSVEWRFTERRGVRSLQTSDMITNPKSLANKQRSQVPLI